MIELRNPEELLEFLVMNYDSPYVGKFIFEADTCVAAGIGVHERSYVFLSPTYPEYIFFMCEDYYKGNIILGLSKSGGSIDQIPSVVLPKSCAGELVFEITQDEKYIDIKLF